MLDRDTLEALDMTVDDMISETRPKKRMQKGVAIHSQLKKYADDPNLTEADRYNLQPIVKKLLVKGFGIPVE